MKTKILIFNGPPGSGKDESVSYLSANHLNVIPFSFKKKLIEITKVIFDITDEQWEYLYTRERKEIQSPMLGGYSPRAALIKVSEEVIKPSFGLDYFGRKALEHCMKCDEEEHIHASTDGGFVAELMPFIKEFPDQILVVRLHRDGCSYAGDSRSYLDDIEHVRFADLYNNGDKGLLYRKLDKLYDLELKDIE